MNESKKGNAYAIGEMILWSLFPVVSLLGLKGLPSIVSLFWVNLFAMVFFLILMVAKGRTYELKNKKAWVFTIGTVILINIMYYGLFFYALDKTTSANAAIISLLEIVPSYIFFQLIKKENILKKHILGILFAVVGALIVLLPKAGGVHTGDFIILIAVFFPPFGNWCQQQTRNIVSTDTALFLRHFMAIPFLFVLAYVFHTPVSNYTISPVIGWLLLNSILIFGLSKILWLEAIHRMSVTRALAINGLNPIFTMLFAWFMVNQSPTLVQIFSLPFLVIAILLLTNFSLNKKETEVAN